MAEVTVCVPAFRSAAFIAHALGSIRAQTFTDFVVEIGLEPDDRDSTIQACRPFLEDARFRLRLNPVRLGWAGNIASLLGRVETPYFAILPHDDAWHPRYLATLLGALRQRTDASVAYADVFYVGKASGMHRLDLPDAGLPERLLAFFLGGAEAVPWRGVARSEVLDRTFPANEFDGFVVECEWALHLIRRGVALRIRQPLFLKRARTDDAGVSAGWRLTMPEITLRRALEHHRQRMLEGIVATDLTDEAQGPIRFAADAAMLRRWNNFSQGRFRFGPEQEERAETILRACDESGAPLDRAIRGRVLLALSRHAAGQGELAESRRLAAAAVRNAPDNWEGLAHLARSHLRDGQALEALPLVARANALAPMALGLRAVEEDCTRQLEVMYADRSRAVA